MRRIEASVAAGRLRGADRIGERVGRAWGSDKMRKHFTVEIPETTLEWRRDEAKVAAVAALDGIYIIRSSLSASESWPAETVVRSYKRLADVERVFRTMKSTELLVRPVFHRNADRFRSHIFLCMLAAHVTWEIEHRLVRFLYVDEGLDPQHAARDPVAPPVASEEGKRKKREHTSAEGHTLHSLPSLLRSVGSLARVTLRLAGGKATFDRDATPTPWQRDVLAAATAAR